MDGPRHPERMLQMPNWMDGCTPTRYPGIMQATSGYRIRARAVDPKTGALREVNRLFENITCVEDALIKQAELRKMVRRGGPEEEKPRVRYGDYTESLLKRKLATKQFSTKKGKASWTDCQDYHLIPAFGDWFVDAITRQDILEWQAGQGLRVERGEYSPVTVNNWLRVLLSTLRSAVIDLDLARDPTRGIRPIDTSTWHTYTEEEPNALTVDEVPIFMAAARRMYPQHYAMMELELATGRRPCEVRPLRRQGPTPDVLWDQGILLIRRSEGLGEAADRTKSKARLRIALPEALMATLRWHVDQLPAGKMRDSDLLFPSRTGGFRSASCLDKPIREIAEATGVKKHLSAYFMRRTFQDLARAAQVHDFVVRSISGHATVEMQAHYSTVGDAEVRASLAQVISIAGLRKEDQPDSAAGGEPGGYKCENQSPSTTRKTARRKHAKKAQVLDFERRAS